MATMTQAYPAQTDNAEVVDLLRCYERRLETAADLDPLLDALGDARCVLLGEASHGMSDYYIWRARLSQRLISEKGFSFIAVEAERYYRTMVRGNASSWNVRDTHMADTLDRLVEHHTALQGADQVKAIVWEHNTHIGDARATDMALAGMVNVGQLVRDRHGAEGVFLVGFGSYQGSVIAGPEWGAPMQKMEVPPSPPDSWEELLHRAGVYDKLLLLDEIREQPLAMARRGHRAIGVVYNPNRERSNYVPTILPHRYDAFVYIDKSEALHPLHVQPVSAKPPETYPWGV